MKKHWQIKPWIAITILVVLLGSIFFAVGIFNFSGMSGKSEMSSYDSQYAGDYSIGAGISAPSVAYNTKSLSVRNESFRVENATDMDSTTSSAERMIIKTGSLSMVVGNVVTTAKTITDYVEKNNGFIVNSTVDKSGLELYGSVTVRVPSKTFNDTISYVKEMGEVKSENISGQDITEEYSDLDAQLKNLKATEEQFLAIMKDAYKIEDVLAVQRELMNVRGQIEVMEGRMKYMKESADMSSLTVYLSTDPSKLPVVDESNQWKPFAILKDAFRSLLDTGKTIVNGLIWVGVYIPMIAIVVVIVWAIRRLRRHLKKRK